MSALSVSAPLVLNSTEQLADQMKIGKLTMHMTHALLMYHFSLVASQLLNLTLIN